MAKTNDFNIDTTEVWAALAVFDNLQEELDEIKGLSDLSGDLLIPKEFYNGCKAGDQSISPTSNNLNLSTQSNDLFTNYLNTIDSIKKYLKELEAVNNNGSLTTSKLNNGGGNQGGVTTATGGAVVVDLGLTEGEVSGDGSDDTSNIFGEIDDGGEYIEDPDSTTNTGYVDDVNNNTNSVSGKNGNTSDGNINGMNAGNGKSGSISEVAGQKVIEEVLDANGNVVAVAVLVNGKKVWYQVVDGKVIVPADSNGNSTYQLNEPITIQDGPNEIVIKPGEYEIVHVVYNADGSVKIIEIKCGNYKLLLHLGSNGNIVNVEYIKPQTGVFSIDNKHYDIYDMYGVKIGEFADGQYYIYETKYDQHGNVIAFRLTPDGEYEKWLVIDENTQASEYALVEMMQTNDKTNVSIFEKNKGLLGLLGVLFIALGATVAVKIKMSKKEKEEYNDGDLETDDYSSYSNFEPEAYDEPANLTSEGNLYHDNAIGDWKEEELSTGNYPIYDVKKDENGVITEARINPLDSDDEYWVEV